MLCQEWVGAHSARVLSMGRALRYLVTLLLASAFPSAHGDVGQVSWMLSTHFHFVVMGDTLSRSLVKTVHGF